MKELIFFWSIFFFNQTPSSICVMCLYCIGKVSNCSIKSLGWSWSAHEGIIYAYTKALLAENPLKFSLLSFHQKLFSHMLNVSTLYRQSIKELDQKLWWKLISTWRHHQCIYKHLIREKLSKFSQLSFCQKLFFLNQIHSCICSMCLHCIHRQSIKLFHRKLW